MQLLFAVLVALGWLGEVRADEVDRLDAVAVVELEVVARPEARDAPAAWRAEARFAESAEASPVLDPGTCLRRPAPTPGRRPVVAVGIEGATRGRLEWDPRRGRYATVGPTRTVDAAWGVGDAWWEGADGTRVEVENVVRFGAVPEVRGVARDADGEVHVGWNPRSVDRVEVVVRGPAGEVVCGAAADGADLPWWTTPALGGEVLVRSVREQARRLSDGTVVGARAVIERLLPIEGAQPDGARVRPPPRLELAPRPPKKLTRAPRPKEA